MSRERHGSDEAAVTKRPNKKKKEGKKKRQSERRRLVDSARHFQVYIHYREKRAEKNRKTAEGRRVRPRPPPTDGSCADLAYLSNPNFFCLRET